MNCSFCKQDAFDNNIYLLIGPSGGVNICSNCVSLCHELIAIREWEKCERILVGDIDFKEIMCTITMG